MVSKGALVAIVNTTKDNKGFEKKLGVVVGVNKDKSIRVFFKEPITPPGGLGEVIVWVFPENQVREVTRKAIRGGL